MTKLTAFICPIQLFRHTKKATCSFPYGRNLAGDMKCMKATSKVTRPAPLVSFWLTCSLRKIAISEYATTSAYLNTLACLEPSLSQAGAWRMYREACLLYLYSFWPLHCYDSSIMHTGLWTKTSSTGHNAIFSLNRRRRGSQARERIDRWQHLRCSSGKFYGPQNALDSTLAWGDILTLTATEIVSPSCSPSS